jgi:hypothetical protein
MSKKNIVHIIAIVFILLFLYTSIDKLINYKAFIEQFEQSPFLKHLPIWAAWLIPVGELAAALLLALKQWRLKGLYASLLIMIVFLAYVIGLSQLEFYAPCDCGGFINALPLNIHIMLNSLFIVLATIALLIEHQTQKSHTNNIAQGSTKVA